MVFNFILFVLNLVIGLYLTPYDGFNLLNLFMAGWCFADMIKEYDRLV